MQQIGHHALFKHTFGRQEVFADVNPDDLFAIAEFDDFGVDFFVFNTSFIRLVFTARENGIKQNLRFGIAFLNAVKNSLYSGNGQAGAGEDIYVRWLPFF